MAEVLTRRMHLSKEQWVFAVVGERGGVHFHIRPENPYTRDERPYAGIEIHRREPIYPGQVSGGHCWLINTDCYHDGSTLVARDFYVPIFRRCEDSGDYEPLWKAVEAEYIRRFQEPSP